VVDAPDACNDGGPATKSQRVPRVVTLRSEKSS
jgi:hypothetical protein